MKHGGKFLHFGTEDAGKMLMRYGCILLQDYTMSQPVTQTGQTLPVKPHFVPVKWMVPPQWGGSNVFSYSESVKWRPDILIDVSVLFPSRSSQIHGRVLQIRTGCNKIKGLTVILMVETKSMSHKSVELNGPNLLSPRENVIELSRR